MGFFGKLFGGNEGPKDAPDQSAEQQLYDSFMRQLDGATRQSVQEKLKKINEAKLNERDKRILERVLHSKLNALDAAEGIGDFEIVDDDKNEERETTNWEEIPQEDIDNLSKK